MIALGMNLGILQPFIGHFETTSPYEFLYQKNNFTNDNSNPKELILYITVEYTDSNQFKISSILKK